MAANTKRIAARGTSKLSDGGMRVFRPSIQATLGLVLLWGKSRSGMD
jgi:hypothetical protein